MNVETSSIILSVTYESEYVLRVKKTALELSSQLPAYVLRKLI